MSTHREIEEVCNADIIKKQKMTKSPVAESLGEINKMGEETMRKEHLGKFDCPYCKRKKVDFYLSGTGNEYICYKCGMGLKKKHGIEEIGNIYLEEI